MPQVRSNMKRIIKTSLFCNAFTICFEECLHLVERVENNEAERPVWQQLTQQYLSATLSALIVAAINFKYEPVDKQWAQFLGGGAATVILSAVALSIAADDLHSALPTLLNSLAQFCIYKSIFDEDEGAEENIESSESFSEQEPLVLN
jgi:hypothetical protein